MIRKVSERSDEPILQLIDEISELKESLREISRKLTRIETKVKRGFSATTSLSKKSEISTPKITANAKKLTELSSEDVLQVYEELRLIAKNGNEEEVRQKLSAMDAAELNLMCWELGATLSGKNPSRKKMLDAIVGRIQQSLMLSRHIDRKAF
ncbi:MAG: hypothetical protein ACM37W_27030 [Actinomycetota bacterium]